MTGSGDPGSHDVPFGASAPQKAVPRESAEAAVQYLNSRVPLSYSFGGGRRAVIWSGNGGRERSGAGTSIETKELPGSSSQTRIFSVAICSPQAIFGRFRTRCHTKES